MLCIANQSLQKRIDEAWLNVTPFSDYKWKIPFLHKKQKPKLPHDFFDMVYHVFTNKREHLTQCFESLKHGGILRIKAHAKSEENLINLLQNIGFENISKETETSSTCPNFHTFNLKNLPKHEFSSTCILEVQKSFENIYDDKVSNLEWCQEFQGTYANFEAAQKAAGSGYDAPAIFQKAFTTAKAVHDGDALWERDSFLFHHTEYREPLLGQLLQIARQEKGDLQVLDFGGSLGSAFMQHKAPLLANTQTLSWNVVEQEHYVNPAQKEFSTDHLQFFYTCEEILQKKKINTLVLSGVLQYLPDTYTTFSTLLDHKIKYIIIDRTAFCKNTDIYTVQVVPTSIYEAQYAHQFMNQEKIENMLQAKGYTYKKWVPSSCDPSSFWGNLYAQRN